MATTRKILLCSVILVFASSVLYGQDYTDKVRHLEKDASSPEAKAEQVSWIAGHWVGNAFGGTVEEIWSPPAGGSMMCAFRLYNEDGVQFYELCTIVEEDNSLMLRLKHFNADLVGWEEKSESVEFPLVALESKMVWFDGFTFELVDNSHLNIYVLTGSEKGQSVTKFSYTRQSPK